MVLCCTSSFAETVSPFGTFDIKSSLPPNHAIDQIAVRSFVADNSGLYFLIDVNPEQPTLAQSLILHTDWRGTRQKLIQLPPSGFGLYEVEKRQYYEPFAKFARKRDLLSGRVVVPGKPMASQVQIPFEGVILQEHSAPISCPTPNFAKGSYDINVDNSGKIYLSQFIIRPKAEENITVFSPQGEFLKVIGFETAKSFCLNNDQIFYIDGAPLMQSTTATIKGLSTNQDSLAQWEAYGPLKLRALTSSKLVVLGKIDCRIQIIDLETGNRRTVSLTPIPDIQQGIAAQDPDYLGRHTERTKNLGRSVVVSDIDTTNNGDIYLNVMGHHIRQGAVVIKLDKEGNHTGRLRCKLPVFDELKTEALPGGQMLPVRIGVSDTYLFILGDGKVARYPI